MDVLIEDLVCDSYDLFLQWESVKVDGRIPTPRHAHACCVVEDSMYVFGGYGLSNARGIHLGDFYRFHLPTSHWEKLYFPGKAKVPPRHSHSMVAWGNSFWVFGGIGHAHNHPNTPLIYNEVVQYNVVTMEVTIHTSDGVGDYVPSPRWGHTGVVYEDQMLIFGGMNEFNFFSSVISFDFKTKQWRQLAIMDTSINPVPHGRQYHSSAVLGDKLYVFGGYDGVLCRNDMFELDLKTLVWRGIAGPHMSRRGASTVVYGNSIYIFGGRNKKIHDSLYEFNTQTLAWKEVQAGGTRPSKRQSSTAVVYRDHLYIFGGQSDYNENDVFRISLSKNTNHQQQQHSADSFTYFQSMLNNPLLSDIKFKVEDRVIFAHKCILISRNEKFKAMITSGMEESRKDMIEIHDVSYSVFMAILNWIYTGHVEFQSVNILHLISVADQYLIHEIKSSCAKGLIKYINKKNYEQAQSIAESYELKDILLYISILNKEIESQSQSLTEKAL